MIGRFLAAEALFFGAACLIHAGVLLRGYEHREAATGEGVVAAILVVGLALGRLGLVPMRRAGLAAQALALAITLVGAFTIVIGVGPRTLPDIVFHVLMIAVLVWGLVSAWSTR